MGSPVACKHHIVEDKLSALGSMEPLVSGSPHVLEGGVRILGRRLLSALLMARGGIHVQKRGIISGETLFSGDNAACHVSNHVVVLGILLSQPGGGS